MVQILMVLDFVKKNVILMSTLNILWNKIKDKSSNKSFGIVMLSTQSNKLIKKEDEIIVFI